VHTKGRKIDRMSAHVARASRKKRVRCRRTSCQKERGSGPERRVWNHQNNRFVTIATIHSYKEGSLAEPEKAIEITQLQPLQFHRIQSAVLPTINTFS